MGISLTAAQRAQLNAYVGRGDYPSVEEAVRQLIDERLAERALEGGDDLAWAKPDVEQALQDAADGNLMNHEDYRAHVEQHLAKLKG